MLTPGEKEQIVSSVSGNFVDIIEMVTKKSNRRSTHWIDIELDRDNCGPTKGVYLDARSYDAISSIIALYRMGRILKEGESITIKVYRHDRVCLELDGIPVLPEDDDKRIFNEQAGSFEVMLDAIRGKHKDVDIRNHVEIDCFIKVCELVKEHISWLEEDDLKSIVLSKFLPELKPDCTFEEIYPILRRKLAD